MDNTLAGSYPSSGSAGNLSPSQRTQSPFEPQPLLSELSPGSDILPGFQLFDTLLQFLQITLAMPLSKRVERTLQQFRGQFFLAIHQHRRQQLAIAAFQRHG